MKYMDLLPHQYPLRLVDEVDLYIPSKLLKSTLNTKKLNWLSATQDIPYSIILEGLAQTAVIFIQLETRPLKKGEFPVLGAVKSEVLKKAPTAGELLSFEVKPLRIHEKQAIIEGNVKASNRKILNCMLTVGVQS